jgi:hypothetical protein
MIMALGGRVSRRTPKESFTFNFRRLYFTYYELDITSFASICIIYLILAPGGSV